MLVRARWTVALVAALLAAMTTACAATRSADEPDAGVDVGRAPATARADVAPPADELPRLDEPVPRRPRTLVATLRRTSERLDDEADRWRRDGDLADRRPPQALSRLATYESRILAVLAARPSLSRAVVPRLPAALARRIAPEVRALRDLRRLNAMSQRRPGPPPRIRLGPPEPLGTLLGHYRAAQRRFGVRWHLLAAVNYVESRFGRLRNESVSGAQGPMQFMPATWRAYGLGGDVRDPRDAIMGAANYLHASGAPRDDARALRAYNPSPLYVSTVRLYARRMAREPRALAVLYGREVVR